MDLTELDLNELYRTEPDPTWKHKTLSEVNVANIRWEIEEFGDLDENRDEEYRKFQKMKKTGNKTSNSDAFFKIGNRCMLRELKTSEEDLLDFEWDQVTSLMSQQKKDYPIEYYATLKKDRFAPPESSIFDVPKLTENPFDEYLWCERFMKKSQTDQLHEIDILTDEHLESNPKSRFYPMGYFSSLHLCQSPKNSTKPTVVNSDDYFSLTKTNESFQNENNQKPKMVPDYEIDVSLGFPRVVRMESFRDPNNPSRKDRESSEQPYRIPKLTAAQRAQKAKEIMQKADSLAKMISEKNEAVKHSDSRLPQKLTVLQKPKSQAFKIPITPQNSPITQNRYQAINHQNSEPGRFTQWKYSSTHNSTPCPSQSPRPQAPVARNQSHQNLRGLPKGATFRPNSVGLRPTPKPQQQKQKDTIQRRNSRTSCQPHPEETENEQNPEKKKKKSDNEEANIRAISAALAMTFPGPDSLPPPPPAIPVETQQGHRVVHTVTRNSQNPRTNSRPPVGYKRNHTSYDTVELDSIPLPPTPQPASLKYTPMSSYSPASDPPWQQKLPETVTYMNLDTNTMDCLPSIGAFQMSKSHCYQAPQMASYQTIGMEDVLQYPFQPFGYQPLLSSDSKWKYEYSPGYEDVYAAPMSSTSSAALWSAPQFGPSTCSWAGYRQPPIGTMADGGQITVDQENVDNKTENASQKEIEPKKRNRELFEKEGSMGKENSPLPFKNRKTSSSQVKNDEHLAQKIHSILAAVTANQHELDAELEEKRIRDIEKQRKKSRRGKTDKEVSELSDPDDNTNL